jgi:hypothetical protein
VLAICAYRVGRLAFNSRRFTEVMAEQQNFDEQVLMRAPLVRKWHLDGYPPVTSAEWELLYGEWIEALARDVASTVSG